MDYDNEYAAMQEKIRLLNSSPQTKEAKNVRTRGTEQIASAKSKNHQKDPIRSQSDTKPPPETENIYGSTSGERIDTNFSMDQKDSRKIRNGEARNSEKEIPHTSVAEEEVTSTQLTVVDNDEEFRRLMLRHGTFAINGSLVEHEMSEMHKEIPDFEDSNWEKVKGFARRQTQKFNAKYRREKIVVTHDKDFEQEIGVLRKVQQARVNTERRIDTIMNAFEMIERSLSQLSKDWAVLASVTQSNPESGLQKEQEKHQLAMAELRDIARKIDFQAHQFKMRNAMMIDDINKGLAPQWKKCSKGMNEVQNLLQERRDALLEMDFFKNKVTKLKAEYAGNLQHPRIIRNEMKSQTWQKKYDTITSQCEESCQKHIKRSQSACAAAASALVGNLQMSFLKLEQHWTPMFSNIYANPLMLLEEKSRTLSTLISAPATAADHFNHEGIVLSGTLDALVSPLEDNRGVYHITMLYGDHPTHGPHLHARSDNEMRHVDTSTLRIISMVNIPRNNEDEEDVPEPRSLLTEKMKMSIL